MMTAIAQYSTEEEATHLCCNIAATAKDLIKLHHDNLTFSEYGILMHVIRSWIRNGEHCHLVSPG